MAAERLDKLLCGSENMSRGDARKIIRAGRVTVNGTVVSNPEEKFEEGALLRLDGRTLSSGGYRYIMMNKPRDVLSATEDKEQKTVLDLLPETMSRRGLFPVGRLDKDVTGLVILTDDGDFGHSVTSPKKRIPKLYEVRTGAELTGEDVDAFNNGLVLKDGSSCLPAKLTVDEKDAHRALVEILEGKYHQVKRMFASRGKPVEELRRIAVGGLALDKHLAEGEFRIMTKEEVRSVVLEQITNQKQK